MGIKEEVDELDAKVARLKVDYEQYFARILKREPLKLREEIDRMILLYSIKSITNTSLKFKYNATVAKYNSYKQYWTRILRAIEEGTFLGRGVAAAAAGEMPSAASSKNSALEEVYSRYIEAKKQCGEPTDGVTFDSFAKSIERSKKKVEEAYKTSEVELKVAVKDGKAKLTITPKGK